MRLLLLFLVFYACYTPIRGEMRIESYGKGSLTYWLIYDNQAKLSDHLVVFLHGYGASNPGCYGGWIKDLISEGNIVLFPKFQTGLWYPSTRKFQDRVDQVIHSAREEILENKKLRIVKLIFVTHSIGGVMAVNLADKYGRSGEFEVGGLVLVQPGFRYLKLGRQKNYEHINPQTRVLLVIGDKDRAAGGKFARFFYTKISHIPQSHKLFLIQYDDKKSGEKILSHHKEPVSPDITLHTGNSNLVIFGSFLVGKTDYSDQYAYWRPSLSLVRCISGSGACIALSENSESITYMGTWNDGTPVKPMEIISSAE